MPWFVPVLCRMVPGYIAVPIVLKPLVDRYAQASSLLLQFVGCFALTLGAGQPHPERLL